MTSFPAHNAVVTRCWRLGLLCLTLVVSMPVLAEVRIEIEGIEGNLLDNVRNFVGTPPSDDPLVVRRFASRIPTQAREALQALGYYEAEIDASSRRDENDWVVEVSVDPGEPVIVSAVNVILDGEASTDPVYRSLREQLPLQEGQPLHHGHYESSKRAFENLALSRGYFDARYETSQIAIDRGQREAEITLHFNSGRRYLLGDVLFSETPLSEDLLQRLVPFEEDEAYSSDRIAALNRNLLSSGYFRYVRVRPRQEQAGSDLRVPIRADLTAQSPNRMGVGIGYATDVGPRLRLNWRRPWVNEAGHSLEVETEFAAVRQNVSAEYTMPLDPPLEHKLQFFGGYQHDELEDTLSDRLTAGIQRQRMLTKGWQQNVFIRWEREQFEQAGVSGDSTLTLPGTSVSRSRSRGGMDPIWADRQFASIEATHPELGSDMSLARFRISSQWLDSIGRHQGIVRAEYGALYTENFDQTPPSLRFFAGGDQSVRGFSYQSLAPEDNQGRLLGGRYLLVGSLEYNYRFAERWRAATFIDVGNAFSDSKFEEGFERGAGVGIRWLSPVGPIRLDLAWGVSDPDLPWRLHLSIGPQL